VRLKQRRLCLLLRENALPVNGSGGQTELPSWPLLIFLTFQEFRIATALEWHVVFLVCTLRLHKSSCNFLDFASMIVLGKALSKLVVVTRDFG
jgi:hypothetical protein